MPSSSSKHSSSRREIRRPRAESRLHTLNEIGALVPIAESTSTRHGKSDSSRKEKTDFLKTQKPEARREDTRSSRHHESRSTRLKTLEPKEMRSDSKTLAPLKESSPSRGDSRVMTVDSDYPTYPKAYPTSPTPTYKAAYQHLTNQQSYQPSSARYPTSEAPYRISTTSTFHPGPANYNAGLETRLDRRLGSVHAHSGAGFETKLDILEGKKKRSSRARSSSSSSRGPGFETRLERLEDRSSSRGAGFETRLERLERPSSSRGAGFETRLERLENPSSSSRALDRKLADIESKIDSLKLIERKWDAQDRLAKERERSYLRDSIYDRDSLEERERRWAEEDRLDDERENGYRYDSSFGRDTFYD